MRIAVGLELNNEGRALAWALDYPGCFAYGAEGPEAVISLARGLALYELWVNQHAGSDRLRLGNYDLRLVDTWTVYTMNDAYELAEDGYAVNAWFKQDWKPLSAAEIEHGLDVLRWSRADLLEVARDLTEEQLDQQRPEERWSIRGILKHMANAEWWYLDRLGLPAGERPALPQDTFERLDYTRAQVQAALPLLAESDLVLGKESEFWSPRKLLRRLAWHERDHNAHILRLLGG